MQPVSSQFHKSPQDPSYQQRFPRRKQVVGMMVKMKPLYHHLTRHWLVITNKCFQWYQQLQAWSRLCLINKI